MRYRTADAGNGYTLEARIPARVRCEKQLRIVPGATHLFEEHGAFEEVARLAGEWFAWHLHGRPDTVVRPGKGA
jgi:hypothetical protein